VILQNSPYEFKRKISFTIVSASQDFLIGKKTSIYGLRFKQKDREPDGWSFCLKKGRQGKICVLDLAIFNLPLGILSAIH